MLVPVLNEERHIRETVTAMCAQQFDGELEFLFADGRSEDRTRAILEELAESDRRLRVLDNPRRQTPSGLNVCLRAARGRYVARMDAHTFYPPTYLADGVARLERGDVAWVAGPPLLRPIGKISRAVSSALSTRLGQGPTQRFADDVTEAELDTGVFAGVWRRDTVLALGGWDERWSRNQDSEMAAHFLAAGERIVCLPQMGAEYVPRDRLDLLARQFFNYGYYRAATAHQHPASMRRAHVLLPALVATLLLSAGGPRGLRSLARLGTATYALVVLGQTGITLRDSRSPADDVLLPVVLTTMHVFWGLGFIWGAVKRPPLAALANVFGATALAARLGRRAESQSVYAPSLAQVQ
ncbi:MAG: glycosyltransferase [Solirubrobacterales bacterium]|nr:glycosyltransferase [Solirubrobacterales bacterium]